MSFSSEIHSLMMALFHLVDTLGADFQNALGVNNGDYEDAILIESAVRSGMDCIVTRNPEHFKPCPIPVYSPASFVNENNASLKELFRDELAAFYRNRGIDDC